MSKKVDGLDPRPIRVESKPSNNIISPSSANLNPQVGTNQNLVQNNSLNSFKSNSDWLEWLKRKRRGW